MVIHCDNTEKEVNRCCINYVIVDKVMLAKGNYSLMGCQQFKVKQDFLYLHMCQSPKLFKHLLKKHISQKNIYNIYKEYIKEFYLVNIERLAKASLSLSNL